MNTEVLEEQDRLQQEDILRFWFGGAEDEESPEVIKKQSQMWYGSSDEVDEQIRSKFGDLIEKAGLEQLLHWCYEPRGALAHVILLDQFTRNIHRGTVNAYANDTLARAIALRAYKRRLDEKLSVPGRIFLYHPFHHSELLTDQDFVCEQLKELLRNSEDKWQPFIESNLSFAESHREIVKRFGRFPHRNKVLSRQSTEEELEFLENASSFGQ